MKQMNEMLIQLRAFMAQPEGWGRAEGRKVYQGLLEFVEANPGGSVFGVSSEGVRRVDISFASETLVELARRYRGSKGFYMLHLEDVDMIENWDAAAVKKCQPILLYQENNRRMIGPEPSRGNREAFLFAMSRPQARAAEFAEAISGMSIANASTKFKQLWEQGFLLRKESTSDSGGVEYVYQRIR